MGKKILVVDDEERMLRVLRLGLKQAGYDVRTASDGEKALQKLFAERYDLVITDIKMPTMSGLELIYEIERLSIAVPVIVMTAFAEVSTAVKSLKHGAVDYIEKPFSIEELDAVIAHVFESVAVPVAPPIESLQQAMDEREKEIIACALRKAHDNKSQAARALRISERTLWYKVKKYNL